MRVWQSRNTDNKREIYKSKRILVMVSGYTANSADYFINECVGLNYRVTMATCCLPASHEH